MYSNAGFLFVGTALRQLALRRTASSKNARQEAGQEAWLPQAAGIIFDSAPAHLTPDIAARCSLLLSFATSSSELLWKSLFMQVHLVYRRRSKEGRKKTQLVIVR